jgi:2-amino-4-hydroxy-6-hydroxymethyldihydropteridine diphosphokinase
MPIAYIGLGSNQGDGCENLRLAWRRLSELPRLHCRRLSSPYRTEPIGMNSPQWFTNAVGEVETDLGPEELLSLLLAVEGSMGRQRQIATRDRIIDLDLLLYDAVIKENPDCRLPHPEMARRLFVLIPLAEIAPDVRDARTSLTPEEMIARIDPEGQKVIKTNWQGECHDSA